MSFKLVRRLGVSTLGILGAIVSWNSKSAMGETVSPMSFHPDRKLSQLQSDTGHHASTQASDLFLPVYSLASDLSIPAVNLAQRELDLTEFCQNYPLNSRCSEVKPGSDLERSPVEIPVPQVDLANSDAKSGWAIAPEVSTLGLGGHIVRRISPNLNARVGVNAFGLGVDINETEFDYEGDLNLFNVSTLIDVQPFKNSGFRLSLGAVFSNNNIEGTADVSDRVADELGEVEVDGETIDIRDLNIDELATIDADIDINNSIAPYFGIGGGNAVGSGKGLGFWWNLGVVLGGSPEAEVSSNISDDVPEALREEVEAAADRALENEAEDLEAELDFINIYPVGSLGISYQF